MKLVSYTQHRKAGYGILKDDGIVDAATRLPDYPDLASLLADVTPLRHLADLPADMALADVTLLPPFPTRAGSSASASTTSRTSRKPEAIRRNIPFCFPAILPLWWPTARP